MHNEQATREPVVRRLASRRRGLVAVTTAAMLIALQGVVASVGAAEPAESSTADDWELIRGPGAITPTDREYEGETALRFDYEFENPYPEEGGTDTILAVRWLPPGERDWTGYGALRFAIDSNDTAGLRAVGVHIQLLSAGGTIVQSPLISFNRSGWEEIELPLYRFKSLIGSGFQWDEVLQERIVIRYQGGPFEPHSAHFGGWQRVADTDTGLPDVADVDTGTVTTALSNGAEIDFVVGATDGLLYGMAGASVAGTALRTDDPARLIHPVVAPQVGGPTARSGSTALRRSTAPP